MKRIKTTNGNSLRTEFQFFEINALKEAANNENLHTGDSFTFGASGETFQVLEKDAQNNLLRLLRVKNNKQLNAYFTEEGTHTTPTNTPKENNNTTTQKTAHNMDTKDTIKQLKDTFTTLITELETNKPQLNEQQIKETLNKLIDERIEQIREANTLHIEIKDLPKNNLPQKPHKAIETVAKYAATRTPVYLYGPAGTGKSCLAKSLADLYNLPFYEVSSPQHKYELDGMVDANGIFRESILYKAFKNGGVFFFDEVDTTPADVIIAFNNLLANMRYTFANNITETAHENFILIAAGNTRLRGNEPAYEGRFGQCASFIDRFAYVHVDYDREIELYIANNDTQLVDFFHALRKEIELSGLTYTVSPRAMRRLMIAQINNEPAKEMFEQAFTGSWDDTDKQQIAHRLDLKDNKYVKLFQEVYIS